MNRKDMLAELNQLTLRYNLTWDDIKSDMNRIIEQINFLLGASYPPATEILTSDDMMYTYREGGIDVPIIADEYFGSVIFPYIAIQVLARDEEFTTVFSKYQQDLMEGKYRMFSNEFNHVPDRFKRNRSTGVFFPANNKAPSRGGE